MSSELAIRVEALGKAYTIRHQHSDHVTLAQVALERAKHPLRRSEIEKFWALEDVSFEVKKGEVLGVIGHNGAGKSTLLKLLTRITGPTTGRIDLWGRVGSLLEVGTGFHPELTGRENVYLNGSILGMTRKEIDRQFDAIVDFAGVQKFLDTPVKRYSSGMYVRLAFAVAAHLETEILLIDEVLAVGDIAFQRKCLDKMHDVAEAGRTVLFVSHHMPSIESLCDRAIVLSAGGVECDGPTSRAIGQYLAAVRSAAGTPVMSRRTGTGEVRMASVRPSDPSFDPAEPKRLTLTMAKNDFGADYFISAHIVDEMGSIVAQCDSRLTDTWLPGGAEQTAEFILESPWLRPGEYRVDTFICAAGVLDGWEGACAFTVSPALPYKVVANDEAMAHGQTLASFSFATGGQAADAAGRARAEATNDP